MTEQTLRLRKDFSRYKKKWAKQLFEIREMLLSNAVMISQVPAPTFKETKRAEMLIERFNDLENIQACVDEMKNVIAIIKSDKPEAANRDSILVFAHMDNQFDESIDQNISIDDDKISGAGIAQDNIALATLLTLPDIIKHLDVPLERNIVLVATTRSHGRGDYQGLRHYIEKFGDTIAYAIELSGVKIGNLKYVTFSRIRCDINVEVDLDSPQLSLYDSSAIVVLNEILTKIYEIPIPNKPKSHINIGMISGGERYSVRSMHAGLKMEITSESDFSTDNIIESINTICSDVSVKYGAIVKPDFFGRHHSAGLNASHPLVRIALNIVKDMHYQPSMQYSNTEVSVPLSRGIPSINIGLTTGEKRVISKNYIDLKPFHSGLLQLLELLFAIQKGYCNE